MIHQGGKRLRHAGSYDEATAPPRGAQDRRTEAYPPGSPEFKSSSWSCCSTPSIVRSGSTSFDRFTHSINRAPQGNIQVPVVGNAEGNLHRPQSSEWKPGANPEDIDITESLHECGELLSIRLIDHVIISGENHLSFVASGYWQHRRTKTAK